MVLPYLPDLLYNNCMIGEFIDSGICIKADYFIGNTKAVLSIGFRKGNNIDFPVTLYNEDIRKLTQPTCKVLAIFCKEYNETYYMKCTYLAKKQDIHKLAAYLSGDAIMLKTLKLPSVEEFEASLDEVQKWAISVGYNENDVEDIIKLVRKKK